MPDDSAEAAEHIETTEWSASSIQDELGFDILSWNGEIYLSSPRGTEGRVYRLTEEGMEEYFSGQGRLGHQLFVWNDTLYAHAPISQTIQDSAGSILAEGLFGKITVTEDAWYAISENSVLRNGELWREFEYRPYDIASCKDQIALSFPFAPNKLWVDDEWFIEQDDQLDPTLHCIEFNDDIQWILGGGRRLLILQDNNLEIVSSEQASFGQELTTRRNGSALEVFVSAPDAGITLNGWVGHYRWSDKSLLNSWEGRTPNQHFGHSLLWHEESLFVSAPNPIESSGSTSYLQQLIP